MAIRNPSPEEIEKLTNKNTEVINFQKNTTNNSKESVEDSLVPVGGLKPKKSRFEPDPIKCNLISGSLYLKDGFVYIRRLNTEEESKLSEIKNAETLNNIINTIFQTAIKSNISINEMPLIDKMYVFVCMLSLSYVQKIKITDLINCNDCSDDYPYEINFLKDIKVRKVDDNFEIPFRIKLSSFDEDYELCFTIPKIKNENNVYNKDISEIITGLTIYLRDSKGIDVPREEWSDLLKWLSNDDKKNISDKLTKVSVFGEKLDLENNNCINPNCRVKNQIFKISIEDLFTKIINGISGK